MVKGLEKNVHIVTNSEKWLLSALFLGCSALFRIYLTRSSGWRVKPDGTELKGTSGKQRGRLTKEEGKGGIIQTLMLSAEFGHLLGG